MQGRTFLITSSTTVEEVKNISDEYTRVAVRGLNSVSQILNIPEHIHEIEVLDNESIKFLRPLPSHVDTLVVSNRTPAGAFSPWGRFIKRMIIKPDTNHSILPQSHESITRVVFPDGQVFKSIHSRREQAAETTKSKTVERTIEKRTANSVTLTKEKIVTEKTKINERESLKRALAELDKELDELDKQIEVQRPTKKARTDANVASAAPIATVTATVSTVPLAAEPVKPNKTVELDSESSDMEIDEPMVIPPSQKFTMESMMKITTVADIKGFKSTTAMLFKEGAISSKLKAARCQRFEFGGDILSDQVMDFPAISQVKLLHDVSLSAVQKLCLKGTIRYVVIDSHIQGGPGDYRDMDFDEGKIEGLNHTLEVIKLLKKNNNIRIGLAIDGSSKPFAKLKKHNAGITEVEINENTIAKAVVSLAGKGVHAIWLGRNVKPEIVALIPDDITNVVVGFDVPVESYTAISLKKEVIFAEGVNLDLYEQAAVDRLRFLALAGQSSSEMMDLAEASEVKPIYDQVAPLEDPAVSVLAEHGQTELWQIFVEEASKAVPPPPPPQPPQPVLQAPPAAVGLFAAAPVVINLNIDDDDVVFVREVPGTVSKRTRSKKRH